VKWLSFTRRRRSDCRFHAIHVLGQRTFKPVDRGQGNSSRSWFAERDHNSPATTVDLLLVAVLDGFDELLMVQSGDHEGLASSTWRLRNQQAFVGAYQVRAWLV